MIRLPKWELYEFGSFRLDVDSRLVTRDGEPVALAPKSFELLLLLVRNAGRAFSKRELMAALWPDTFVEEANLSFQVSTLRKALGDGGSRWIETLPKHGYRFSADVRTGVSRTGISGDLPQIHPVQSPVRRPRLGTKTYWIATGIVLVAVAFAVTMGRPSHRPDDKNPSAIPLTAYEGAEWAPSLSPDGSQVAFSWTGPSLRNYDIYVKVVGPGEPIQLTTDRTRDDSPAWSPDGRTIAFLRWASPTDREVDVMVVPALGGAAERRVATVAIRPTALPLKRLSWTPDGRWLAIAGDVSAGEGHGIWLFSVEGGERRRLTESPGGGAGLGAGGEALGDVSPAFSSDGRHVAFIRETTAGASAIYVQTLSADLKATGIPAQITEALPRNIGVAWSPENTAILFTGGSSYGQSRLYRIPLTRDRSHPAGSAQLLPFGEQATTLSVSHSGRMIYAAQFRDSALWQLNLANPERGPVPSGVIGSTYDEHTPAYSRDGSRVAFASTRTGSEELWVSNVDGTNLRQVTFLGGPTCANPQWSPVADDVILFNSRQHGPNELYLLDLNTASQKRLTTNEFDDSEARWSRDGKWIYFSSTRTGRAEIWRLPAGGGLPVQITYSGGIAATEGADGFLYYARAPRSPTSIWRVPISGGKETLVAEGLSYSSNFAVGREALYFLSRSGAADDTAIERVNLKSLARTRLVGIGKRWWFGVALNPDEQWLLYSVVENMNSNLMLVDGVK